MQARSQAGSPSRAALETLQTRIHAIALIHEHLYKSTDLARIPAASYVRNLTASILQALGTSTSSGTLELAIEDLSIPMEQAVSCGLILNELVTNAFKHAFPDGRRGAIRAELAARELGHVRLAVTDTGVGLALDRDMTTGDTLGLKRIGTLARQLDATLEIERREGTAFILTFPVR